MPESLHQMHSNEWHYQYREKNVINQTTLGIRDSDNAIIFICLDADIKINCILQQLRLSNTKIPQLVQGITCIAVNTNHKIYKSDAGDSSIVQLKPKSKFIDLECSKQDDVVL